MKVPPNIKVGSHVNDKHPPVTLWLFHPLTGKPADDLDDALAALPFFQRRKAEKAVSYAKSHGGRFYWRFGDGGWQRVELLNFSFVACACGQQVTLEHNFPESTDRMEWVKQQAGVL